MEVRGDFHIAGFFRKWHVGKCSQYTSQKKVVQFFRKWISKIVVLTSLGYTPEPSEELNISNFVPIYSCWPSENALLQKSLRLPAIIMCFQQLMKIWKLKMALV